MTRLMLATASALVLGLAGAGYAAEPAATGSSPPTTTMPATPAPSGAMHGTQAEATPATMSEDEIREAQQQLKTTGFYKGAIDGKIGSETRQAIRQFQQHHSLPATGDLDEPTMAALESSTGGSGSSTTHDSSMTPATPGSSATPGAPPSNSGMRR